LENARAEVDLLIAKAQAILKSSKIKPSYREGLNKYSQELLSL